MQKLLCSDRKRFITPSRYPPHLLRMDDMSASAKGSTIRTPVASGNSQRDLMILLSISMRKHLPVVKSHSSFALVAGLILCGRQPLLALQHLLIELTHYFLLQ
jgi:hypothetical protein